MARSDPSHEKNVTRGSWEVSGNFSGPPTRSEEGVGVFIGRNRVEHEVSALYTRPFLFPAALSRHVKTGVGWKRLCSKCCSQRKLGWQITILFLYLLFFRGYRDS